MAEFAIHPPVHVTTHPDEPIRSVEAAAKFVARHTHGTVDPAVAALLHDLNRASTPEQADAAGRLFRQWAEKEGLLLIPPED